MGYRIEYDTSGNAKFYSGQKRRLPKGLLAGIGAAGILAVIFFSGLGEHIRNFFLPDVSEAALTALVEDLRSGESLSDAVTAFCEEVIENADLAE